MGPVESLDRAFGIVRGTGWPLVGRSWLGGGLVAAAVIVAYYVETIEGAGALRFALAAALLGAWGARSLLLSDAARWAVRTHWDGQLAIESPPRTDVLRTSAAVAAGLWVWLWIPLGALWLGPIAFLLLPLLALRGAVAPSWIARAGTQAGGGVPALARAVGDTHGRRVVGVLTELLLLAGVGLLAVNVFGVFAFGVLVARSFLGLDVALVESFLTPENGFVLLVVVAVSAVALEPVRVGWSVLVYGAARARREGFELRALVDRAVETTRSGARGSRSAVLALVLVLGACADTRAQEAAPTGKPPARDEASALASEPSSEPSSEAVASSSAEDRFAGYTPTERDLAVQADVQRILERGEFRELEDVRSQSLREVVDRLLDWLVDRVELPDLDMGPDPRAAPFPLPNTDAFLFIGLLLLVGVLGYVLVTRARAERADAVTGAQGAAGAGGDPRDRSPASHLDEAGWLAAQGRHRDALRALYLATLVSLDRRRAITFDPSRTNWHYMRQMAPGPTRDLFGRFTRLFDHKWYGDEPTSASDYESGRALADALCHRDDGEPGVP